MKLALHSSNGSFLLPQGFHSSADTVLACRQELADWMETNPDIKTIRDYADPNMEQLVEQELLNGIGCIRIQDVYGTRYFIRNAMTNDYGLTISVMVIADVDETKLWLLDDYDGIEGIRYFEVTDCNQLKEMM